MAPVIWSCAGAALEGQRAVQSRAEVVPGELQPVGNPLGIGSGRTTSMGGTARGAGAETTKK